MYERVPEDFVEQRAVLDDQGTTYRCRLYREMEEVLPGKSFVVEVWDNLDKPVEGQDLPASALIAECQGNSNAEVREKVDEVLRSQGYPITGCWNLRGSL